MSVKFFIIPQDKTSDQEELQYRRFIIKNIVKEHSATFGRSYIYIYIEKTEIND